MRNWIIVVLGIGVWLWCSCSPELTLISPDDSVIDKDIDAGSDSPDGGDIPEVSVEEVDIDDDLDVLEIDSAGDNLCIPDCTDKECGSNGCDGTCGSCLDSAVCTQEGTCVECPEGMSPDGNRCSMPVCGAPGVCDLCSAPEPLAGKGLKFKEIRLLTDNEELVEMDLTTISEPQNFLGNALGEFNLMDALLLHLVNAEMKPFLFSPGYAEQCTEEAFDLYLLPSKPDHRSICPEQTTKKLLKCWRRLG